MFDGMAPNAKQDLAIMVVPSARRAEAIAWLWPQHNPATLENLMQVYEKAALKQGAGYWNGLIGAFRAGQLVGAAWAEVQPGRVAALHGPRTSISEPPSLADELLLPAMNHAIASQVSMLQALKSPAELPEIQALQRQDLRHVADLTFLHRELVGQIGETDPVTPLAFLPYCAEHDARLRAVIERTYQGSLDCPAVDGLRTIDEVLAGYRATGLYRAERWLIASASLEPAGPVSDVGCLLLAEQPASGHWELLYMGVVPEARGRGWGLDMVRRAVSMAQHAGATGVLLAVDAANLPGLQMYAAADFTAFDRRKLYLRVLRASDSPQIQG